MKVENSAKAVIVSNKTILLVKNSDQFNVGEWYCLPGGRQHPGENLLETLERECMEEINVFPTPIKLIAVREYIHKNHELAKFGEESHKIEFMFLCELKEGASVILGKGTDNSQVNLEWVPLEDLPNTNVFPRKLKRLTDFINDTAHVYWGDIL